MVEQNQIRSSVYSTLKHDTQNQLTRQCATAQLQTQADQHQKKLMGCVWLMWRRDLLGTVETNPAHPRSFYSQLYQVAGRNAQKRPEQTLVKFFHDDARPYFANTTHQKLKMQGEVLFLAHLTRLTWRQLSFIRGVEELEKEPVWN